MGYLTHKEKSILFSALTKEEKLCKENGLEDLVPIVKSLEGKFYYDRFEKEIRNKAVDEFVEKMEAWNENIKSIRKEDAFFTIENIRKIAEQMKKE